MAGKKEKRARKRRVWRLLLTLPVLLVALLLAFYFLTGSYFLTEFALPFAGRRLGVELAAERVEWDFFRNSFRVKELRIGPRELPHFTASSAEGVYQLRTLTEKMPAFTRVNLDGAELTLYHIGGGRWDVTPERPARKHEAKRSGKHFRIDLGEVAIQNSRLRLIFGDPDAGSAAELSDLSLKTPRFANDERFQLNGEGKIRLSSSRANHIETGRFKRASDAVLSPALLPEKLTLDAGFDGLFGSVSGEPFNDGALSLHLATSMQDNTLAVDELHFAQSQGGKLQSETKLNGKIGFSPFDFQAGVEKLDLSEEAASLRFDLLFHFTPGRAKIRYHGGISYGNGRFAATGALSADRTGDAIIGLERIELPPLRLEAEHDFEIDMVKMSADLRGFSVRLADRSREVASLKLRNPAKYDWQDGAPAGDRRVPFDLECDNFDLRILRFLLPADPRFQFDTGYFTTRMQLLLRNRFSVVSFLGSGKVEESRCRWKGRTFELAELSVGLDGEIQRSFDFTLRNLSLGFRNEKKLTLGIANFQGEGTLSGSSAKLSGRLEQLTPELAAWLLPGFGPFLPEWRRLGFGVGEMSFSLEKAADGGGISSRSFVAALTRDGKQFLRLSTGEFEFDPATGMPAGEMKFKLTGNLPAEAFNPYLADRKMKVNEGKVKLSVDGSLSRNFGSALVQGDLTFEELGGEAAQRKFRSVSGQCAFNCYLPSTSLLEFRSLNFYVRHAGKPALRLECPGIWEIDAGNYSGDWTIRYLNEQFVSLFAPTLATEVQLSGALRVIGRESFRALQLGGAVELAKWQLPDPAEAPFSGRLTFGAEKSTGELTLRRFNLLVKQQERRIVEMEAAGRAEIDHPAGPVNLRVNLPHLDLEKLLIFAPAAEAPAPETAKEVEPPRLQWGTHPIDLLCNLDKVSIAPGLVAGLDALVQFRQGSIAADSLRLQLNNARYNGSFKGTNRPGGVFWDIALRGFDTLEMAPLLKVIRDDNKDAGSGTLREFDLALRFLADGKGGQPGENFSGSLTMQGEDFRIANAIESTVFGRLLLLPVDLLAEFGKILPTDFAAWKERILDSRELKQQVRSIRFSRGRLRLKADEGHIKVEECALFGDWVSRLLFSGDFELGGERKLNLVSTVNVNGIQAAIPIRGTLSDPLVEFNATSAETLAELWKKLGELNIIGLSAAPGDGGKAEPVIMIDKIPSAGTIRKLYHLFQKMVDE